jgi:drug/metabolite transporter (DMT)-like permease
LNQLLITGLAVLLRIISNPAANVFQKKLTSKKHHPLLVNFISYLLLAILCIPLLLNGLNLSLFSGQFWMYSILMGIAGALGNGFLVKALELGDLSVLGPINSYKSVVGILIGIILLGEIPNVWGIAGLLLIIYGSYFVLDTKEEKLSFSIFKKPEIQYRILALVLTAIEAVFIKKVILLSSTTTAFESWCIFGALFSLLFLIVGRFDFKQEIARIKFSDTYQYLLLVFCIGIMQFTTTYTFDHMDVGYALALFQLSIIITVIFGHRFFKEQNIRRKIIGSVIMIAGSVLIILLKK